MRRAAFAVITTIAGLVLLLQFKTHPTATSGALVDLGATASPRQVAPQHHHTRHPSATPTPTPNHTHVSPTTPATTPATTPKPRHTTTSRTTTSTGRTVTTPYGPVQVRIVESAGRLTNVVALQVPSGNPRSTEIAANATPILRSEALRADSARIHVVSGATYTSNGYAQSLQSAIDGA